LSLAAAVSRAVPLLSLIRELYAMAAAALGPGADLTRYSAFVDGWNTEVSTYPEIDESEARRRAGICEALIAGVHLGLVAGTSEVETEVHETGSDITSVLTAVNAGSGMSSATVKWVRSNAPDVEEDLATWRDFVGRHGRGLTSPAMTTSAALLAQIRQ
ncbi:MAG TPA: hypothetical protein VNG12_05925, partial [Acidimicrobiales bacterium]|nr:hypothetical protein [Acidimicrobiales bacterium]